MSLCIVMVEDNRLNSELACDLLELAGHRVQLAATAAAFRALLAREPPPDLVLMDVSLPDGNGVELLAAMRGVGPWAPRVAIALTAHALATDEPRFLAAGFDAVLTKPIDTRTFVADIERWASTARPRRSR